MVYSNYLCCAPGIAAVGTIFNIISYEAVFCCDLNLSPSCYVTATGTIVIYVYRQTYSFEEKKLMPNLFEMDLLLDIRSAQS